jgi:nucleotide-binding universal stress UspA family protein
VPVNFTANSANAARYVGDLALAIGADIHLIYVFQPPVSAAEVPLPESVFEEMLENGQELLSGIKTDLIAQTAGKIHVTTTLETGGVELKIETFCKEKKPLLVVMGATGDSLENVLSGSNTARALRHLPYPILVVPEGSKFRAVERIVLACDKEDVDSGIPETIPLLRELSDLMGARLEVVHVLTNSEEYAAEAIEEYNVWKKEAKAFEPEIRLIHRHSVEEGIRDFLEVNSADWLMVFPKSHSMLELHHSRSRQILHHCTVPVISVHE